MIWSLLYTCTHTQTQSPLLYNLKISTCTIGDCCGWSKCEKGWFISFGYCSSKIYPRSLHPWDFTNGWPNIDWYTSCPWDKCSLPRKGKHLFLLCETSKSYLFLLTVWGHFVPQVANMTKHLPHLWDLCTTEIIVRSTKHILKVSKSYDLSKSVFLSIFSLMILFIIRLKFYSQMCASTELSATVYCYFYSLMDFSVDCFPCMHVLIVHCLEGSHDWCFTYMCLLCKLNYLV